ncbi:response regulator transcription factor [Zobellella denitrificans]|jgi:CheY-like chemotaxis protein|uniref:Response regulator receiver protein n=1 Tax=Zobellella denitrificans TaxID=347534 RepID=A0A291HPK6_9GAMM|nr:response regulator [Zobellella denitrificans]ATG74074.1 response regulator receiver protein [Zobellella denitrificans]
MTQAKAMTLLLVDDSRVARLSLVRQLQSLPLALDILEAASADEAEALMQQRQADAALIDFNMPGRDGIELASLFRQRHPRMKLALVTANIQDALVKRARELDMTFVAKPASLDDLARFLEVA